MNFFPLVTRYHKWKIKVNHGDFRLYPDDRQNNGDVSEEGADNFNSFINSVIINLTREGTIEFLKLTISSLT